MNLYKFQIIILYKFKPVELPCNCRKKDECPLDGKCRAENLIYQATSLIILTRLSTMWV